LKGVFAWLSKCELQGREFEGNLLLGHAVSQVDAIVGQLRLAQLNPPGGLARLRGGRLAVRGCRLGEQPLPVQCTVLLAYDPGFQPGAAHFADLQALIGQVELCFRDFEALQAHEWIALQVIDRQRRERGVQVEQAQLEGLAEIQFVARAGAERAALESQGRCVADVWPEVRQRHGVHGQAATGAQWGEVQLALPADVPAAWARGRQCGVGSPILPGDEVVQLQIQLVVKQVDRLAGALINEAQLAGAESEAVQLQRKYLAFGGRRLGLGFLLGGSEQLRQVEGTVLGKAQLRSRCLQVHFAQVQGAPEQAVPGEIDIQVIEADVLLLGCAQ